MFRNSVTKEEVLESVMTSPLETVGSFGDREVQSRLSF
jgi:hypothetical protein